MTPVRFLACLLSAPLLLAPASEGRAAELTRAACEADYRELLAAIETNRKAGQVQIDAHLEGVTDEKERAQLIEMREKTWDTEEEQRTMAANIRRDCLAAVKD